MLSPEHIERYVRAMDLYRLLFRYPPAVQRYVDAEIARRRLTMQGPNQYSNTMSEEMYEVYKKHGGHKKHPLDEIQGL